MSKYSKEAIATAINNTADFIKEHPEKWESGQLATDASGQGVDPQSDKAVCWCALGRIVKELEIEPADVLTENELEEFDLSDDERCAYYYPALDKIGIPTDEVFNRNDTLKHRQRSGYTRSGMAYSNSYDPLVAFTDYLRNLALTYENRP